MFRTLLKAIAIILLGTLALSAQNSTSVASSVPRLVNYLGNSPDAQNGRNGATSGDEADHRKCIAPRPDQLAGRPRSHGFRDLGLPLRGRAHGFLGGQFSECSNYFSAGRGCDLVLRGNS
jgi:hypothetical protein